MADASPPSASSTSSASSSGATFQYSQSSLPGRVLISAVLGDGKDGASFIGQTVTVGGWVRSGRLQEKDTTAFLALTDGTCHETLQVIVREDVFDVKKLVPTGTSVAVRGTVVESPAAGQVVELHGVEVLFLGECDATSYVLSKKAHSLEYLRSISHLRMRTMLLSSVFRVRNALAYATHVFFQERNFSYIHTPIITSSDCEGAGEMFQLSTLLPAPDKTVVPIQEKPVEEIAAANEKVTQAGAAVRDLKEKKASKSEIKAAVEALNACKAEVAKLEKQPRLVGGLPQTDDQHVDYSQDFFSCPAYLTVSGQLQVETFCQAMSNVYTFGPTFRAEDSHTSRHLAEFWMIEPEIAFADLEDNMRLAEDYVKFCCHWVLERNMADLKAIDKYHEFAAKQAKKGGSKKKGQKATETRKADEPAVERVTKVANADFQRITYTDAIEVLKACGKKFDNPVEWGIDLASEHERYLAEEHFKLPTIIYNYPKDIKAFYMRMNEDGKTVAAMDLVCPQIGELIGGSQREERPEKLLERITELGLKEEDFSWYLDLRRFGTAIHSGFGLGFERLILFVTGMENIRDVIPFPRVPGAHII
eukprot:TRINITY_DN10283_c0_g1_i3.p1 TRINITY_DN10283_c0_g1~~TRINITY_DN10283_c0_g1_i3.p1  ORF type:complete len:597 (-),score=239.77 TRINITY_DN10283_c0_g1_i3:172-1941(-)